MGMSSDSNRPNPPQDVAPEAPEAIPAQAALHSPSRIVRVSVAGVLMGIANLIPGVSGGTMVLAMGLYQEFIDSVADVTSLRLSVRRVVFLGLIGLSAIAAILAGAKLILWLLFYYPIGMYAAFIGLTLGGAPALMRSLKPVRADVGISAAIGLLAMIGILLLRQGAGFPHNVVMDVISGIVGATTMVLPGVSGSYMLAVLDQYGRVVGAVDDRNLAIIVPVGIGAVAGVVGLSHLLRVLLHRYERATVGVLLGILLGSVIGLWPFGKAPEHKILERRSPAELRGFVETWQITGAALPDDTTHEALVEAIGLHWPKRERSGYEAALVARAILLAGGGFCLTWGLSRLQRPPVRH